MAVVGKDDRGLHTAQKDKEKQEKEEEERQKPQREGPARCRPLCRREVLFMAEERVCPPQDQVREEIGEPSVLHLRTSRHL